MKRLFNYLIIFIPFCICSCVGNKSDDPIINALQKKIFLSEVTRDTLSTPYYHVRRSKKEGLFDRNGDQIIPMGKYSRIECTTMAFKVFIGDEVGICALDGTELIHPEFQDITTLENITGLYKVKENGLWGLVDSTSHVIIKPGMYDNIEICRFRYDYEIDEIKPDYFIVTRKGKKGVCDRNGELLIKPTYTNIDYIGNSFAVWKGSSYYGICNITGKEIIAPDKYQSVGLTEYSDNYYVEDFDDLWGICNPDGKEIIPTVYQYIDNTEDGYYTVMDNSGLYGIFDHNGKQLLKCKYYGISYDGKYFYIQTKKDGPMERSYQSINPEYMMQASGEYTIHWPYSYPVDVTIEFYKDFISVDGIMVDLYSTDGFSKTYRQSFYGTTYYIVDPSYNVRAVNEVSTYFGVSREKVPVTKKGNIFIPQAALMTFVESSVQSDGQSSSDSFQRKLAYYKENYTRWERQAASIFNSISNIAVRNSNGSTTGYSNVNDYGVNNLASMKNDYSSAQREMRNLRMEAQQEGITIQASSWETTSIQVY